MPKRHHIIAQSLWTDGRQSRNCAAWNTRTDKATANSAAKLLHRCSSIDRETSNMSTKTPDPRDIEVGRRVRALRMERGMSQTDLGGELGLTFQQVQKYEKGTNRISAG